MNSHDTPATASSSDTVCEPEAAQYITLSRAYLRQARRKGRGPSYIKIGRAIRYRIADLDEFLNAHRVEPRGSR
jgi:predicted DNA-binding transcriptional regulator AlpA